LETHFPAHLISGQTSGVTQTTLPATSKTDDGENSNEICVKRFKFTKISSGGKTDNVHRISMANEPILTLEDANFAAHKI
jgi:hypothetical protein